MDLFLRLVGIAAAVFTAVGTVVMVRTYRRERTIGVLAPLLAGLVSLVMLPVFLLITGARLNPLCAAPILLLGLMVGAVRGQTTRLGFKDGQVMGRNSPAFLLGWGISWVLTQLLSLAGSSILASLSLAPLFLSTGTQVGLNGNLFLRRLAMREPSPEQMPETSPEGSPEWTTPPQSAVSWRLVLESGRQAGRSEAMGSRVRLGRSRDCEVRLDDSQVSRHHATIERVGSVYRITDLNSTAGTYVNGTRLRGAAPLHEGDSIRVGRTRLTVRSGE